MSDAVGSSSDQSHMAGNAARESDSKSNSSSSSSSTAQAASSSASSRETKQGSTKVRWLPVLIVNLK